MSILRQDSDKIAAARLWLVSEQAKNLPYLSAALYALAPVASNEVPRATVDEHWRLYLNPRWLTQVSVPELGAELAHLLWHLLHDHAVRSRTMGVRPATAASWHSAADAALTGTLEPDDLLPPDLATPATIGQQPGRSAEEYYAALSGLPAIPEQATGGDPGQGCGSGADGLLRSHELPPDTDVATVDADDAHALRRRVAIDYQQHVTSRGDRPGDAARWAREILEPRIAWEPLLAGAVRRAAGWTNGHTEYTYLKRSRRQSAVPQVVLPGTRRRLPTVAMVVDTSGSVDDTLLGRALGEVDGALRGLGVAGGSVTVLACDAAVHTVSRVRKATDTRLAGGGGTDMAVGLAAADELRPKPDLVVVFTDGYTPWPASPPPGCAVVVAVLGRHGDRLPPTPPWAKRIECLLDA